MAKSFVFEGIECAGKSTLSALTSYVLRKTTSFPVLTLHEPGDTLPGSAIRHILLGSEFSKDMDPTTAMLLYTAARNELYAKKINPFFAEHPNGITIGDRCWWSTALQIVDGVNPGYLRDVQSPYMSYPDRIFYVDIPVDEVAARMSFAERVGREINWRDQRSKDVFEGQRQQYYNLVTEFRDRTTLLNGFRTPWDLVFEARQEILTEVATDERLREIALSERDGFTSLNKLDLIRKAEADHIYSFVENEADDITIRQRLELPSKKVLEARMLSEWQAKGFELNSTGRERAS